MIPALTRRLRDAAFYVMDPNVKGTGIVGSPLILKLSGLQVGLAVAGRPLTVNFTADNTQPFWSAGFVPYEADTLTGVITQGGTVVLLLGATKISVGTFGQLSAGQFASVGLVSQGSLPSQFAGQSITVYVGPQSEFSGLAVGASFGGTQYTLSAAATVSGSASTGGSGSGGQPTTSGSGSQPTTVPSGGFQSGIGSSAGVVVAGIVVVGIGALLVSGSRRGHSASEQPYEAAHVDEDTGDVVMRPRSARRSSVPPPVSVGGAQVPLSQFGARYREQIRRATGG